MGQTEEVKAALQRYIVAFNKGGAFPQKEFDDIFAANFHVTKEEYNEGFEHRIENKYNYCIISRDDIRKTHEGSHSKGTTVKLSQCNLIGIRCLNAKLHMKNGEDESKVNMVFTVKDGKIAHGREVDTATSFLRAGADAFLTIWGFKEGAHPESGRSGDAPTLGLDQGAHPNAGHLLEHNPDAPSLGLFEGPHPTTGRAGDAPAFGLNEGPHPKKS
mmetsp:Transcript_6256/g.15573  ORF Transcript_6256/g.15573 Transcript_6256/m.15573 type:complete len:216 (-) Transcript_6256:166-813(-)